MPCPISTPPPSPPVPSWWLLGDCDNDPPNGQNALPSLVHTLHQEGSSVLSVAADEHFIYTGGQTMDIFAWDRESFTVKATLKGHMGSVLALEVCTPRGWLFSSSGDSTVRVWSTKSLTPLWVIAPYADYDAGDIFSLTFSQETSTLFIGCQNTSLQWFDFSSSSEDCSTGTVSEMHTVGGHITPNSGNMRKVHRFFESEPQPLGRPPATPRKGISSGSSPHSIQRPLPSHLGASLPEDLSGALHAMSSEPKYFSIPAENCIPSAHFGYIYCMSLFSNPAQDLAPEPLLERATNQPVPNSRMLVTGGGDEDVKLWSMHFSSTSKSTSVKLLHTFCSDQGAILSLITRNGNIYAGCQGGHIKIWDVETKTLVRTIIALDGVDILSLSMTFSELYACLANGTVQRYSNSFERDGCWTAHGGTVLSSIIVTATKSAEILDTDVLDFITGASDNRIKVWALQVPRPPQTAAGRSWPPKSTRHLSEPSEDTSVEIQTPSPATDTLVEALSQFVSFKSISSNEKYREDCRQTAIWLRRCFIQFGADARLLYGMESKNPVVLATFSGNQQVADRRRVLFYGHYDVFPTGASATWDHEPFNLTGMNGYLYGRGVSDDKGPILVVASAASELLAQKALDVDLVMLIEGEEESGSDGFDEVVRKNRDAIGPIDAILVSNSYWIDETHPCITYGLRGVIHSTLEISFKGPDAHSGLDGGAYVEPMSDMVKLLARLSDGSKVAIPGFYDTVRPHSGEEDSIFEVLASITGKSVASFSSRWREPAFSLHSIADSGFGNTTIIPSQIRAKVSLRIVPDQDLTDIVRAFKTYITQVFEELQSPNGLEITIDRTADWWIGNFEHPGFKALEGAIAEEWGVEPLRIREGGSIPSIPFLEKELGCPALHLPMGQRTDQAHLSNERISLTNLRKGKAVVKGFLRRLATS